MHHIFVEEVCVNIKEREICIDKSSDGENYNHLVNALRIEKGENVLCSVVPFESTFDYKCVVADVDREKVILFIEEKTDSNELPIGINLYQGICKSDKMELILEKAVELGIKRFIPMSTEFCVAKMDVSAERFKNKINRLKKISKSAAEQSKRSIIPEVVEPLDFMKICDGPLKNKSYNLLFYENEDNINNTRDIIKAIKKNVVDDKDIEINIYIGAEGGFSDREIKCARESGFEILTLGKRILRTETAAITALSIFMYEFES